MMEEFEHRLNGDFYEGFESSLEDDEITAEEGGFMVGFNRADD